MALAHLSAPLTSMRAPGIARGSACYFSMTVSDPTDNAYCPNTGWSILAAQPWDLPTARDSGPMMGRVLLLHGESLEVSPKTDSLPAAIAASVSISFRASS